MFKDGETFTELGDASPENVKELVAPHIMRMSATRAKARALRDALNIGMCSVEELSDIDNSQSATGADVEAPTNGEMPPGYTRQQWESLTQAQRSLRRHKWKNEGQQEVV